MRPVGFVGLCKCQTNGIAAGLLSDDPLLSDEGNAMLKATLTEYMDRMEGNIVL